MTQRKNDLAASTPAELLALADALSDFSDGLDAYIKASPNLFSPPVLQLRSMDTHIASAAAEIGMLAVSEMAADTTRAIGQLQEAITAAKATVTELMDVRSALNVVAAVLSVAASLSTGNPFGAASSVFGLVDTISGAVKAAKAA